MRVLQHIADAAVQPQLRTLAVVHAVDENFALCRLKKPAGKVDQGALARTRLAYDGDRHALRDF